MPVGEVTIPFKSFADGVNNADPTSDVGARYRSRYPKYQVVDALDIMLHTKKQRPGSQLLTDTMNSYCRGLGTYLRHDGTEYMLAVYAGKLVSIDTSSGVVTELYTLNGNSEAWFADYLDICIVANGTSVVKVEGGAAYPLGIAAPAAGPSASAVAGGSLTAGVYTVYIGYARKVSSSNVLYSKGLSLGSVTLSGGNLTVRISDFTNSSDLQVNNKVVWMTDADGSTYYFYHQTNDNTTTTVDVSSASAKSTSILYLVEANTNDAVPAFEYIAVLNKYLYGSVDNILYRSRQAGDRYQLERFDTDSSNPSKSTYPFVITGIFAIDPDIYLNTPAGILRIPNGDINAQFEHVEKQDNFKYPRTVVSAVVNGVNGLLGVTSKKIGFFDGHRILEHDLGRDVKAFVEKMFVGANDNNQPAGCIYRRNSRIEYHLGYRDLDVGIATNNRRLILNLDTLQVLENNRVNAAWEPWSNGFNYMVTLNSGAWYCVQSHESKSVVYYQHGTRNVDINIYKGNTYTAEDDYGGSIKTGTFIPSIRGLVRWINLWFFGKLSETMTAKVVIEKWPSIEKTTTIDPASSSLDVPRYGVARYGVDRYAPESPIRDKGKLSRSLKGNAVHVLFTLSGEDRAFEFINAELYGILTESRFT